MANKFILKSVGQSLGSGVRKIERNLFGLSKIGIQWDESLIKSVRGIGASSSDMENDYSTFNRTDVYNAVSSVSGNNDYIAYFDQTYAARRDFLRRFALQGEIEYILDQICNETIVYDKAHYYAYPNNENLASVLKPDVGKELVDDINESFRRVYTKFRFHESDDAWQYMKKFLTDGFLAFEIIYRQNEKTGLAEDIIGFQELDPITLEPGIKIDQNGNAVKVWTQFKDDPEKERVLLDSNVIYISWAKNNFVSRISYVERLVRSFNMLRTLENSRIIWNVQNAQKRLKFIVPIGSQSEQMARTRLNELQNSYKEDVIVDNNSGEITVNGQPKFSFNKTFFFPSREGTSTEISEIGVEGYDLNSVEPLKYFWQRFIIESQLPKDRFTMLGEGDGNLNTPTSNSAMSKEEYKFSLFINRVRTIFKELLIKPTWIQFCLKHPEFSTNTIFQSYIGLDYNEENLFVLAKERAILNDEAQLITTLYNLTDEKNEHVFSMKFLTRKYLGISDSDWELNKRYKEEERKASKEEASQMGQQNEGMMGGDYGGTGFGGDYGMNEGGFSDIPAEPGGEMNSGGEAEISGPTPESGGGEPL